MSGAFGLRRVGLLLVLWVACGLRLGGQGFPGYPVMWATAGMRAENLIVAPGQTLHWGYVPEKGTSGEIALVSADPLALLPPAEAMVVVYRQSDGVPVAAGWATAREGQWYGDVVVNPGGLGLLRGIAWEAEVKNYGELALLYVSGETGLRPRSPLVAVGGVVGWGTPTVRLQQARLTFEGLAAGTYRMVAWQVNTPSTRTPFARQGLANGAPAITGLSAPPEVTLEVEILSAPAGRYGGSLSRDLAVWESGSYRVTWSSRLATHVELHENGVVIASGLGGSVVRSGMAPTRYQYRAVASGPGGSRDANKVIDVVRRDLSLNAALSNPSVGLTPLEQAITLGEEARLEVTSIAMSEIGRTRLFGPGLERVNPSGPVAFTPSASGRHRYTAEADGTARLRWLVELSVQQLLLTTPSGQEVDVTAATFYRATESGLYTLTLVDDDGQRFTSAPLSVSLPRVSAEAWVSVRPRIDSFLAESPPVPRAELSRASEGRIEVGKPIPWLTRVENGEGRLTGEGVDRLHPPPRLETVPADSGQQSFRLRVEPPNEGRLRWSVVGAVLVEINGVRREGSEASVPAGEYRLRAVGPDGLEAHAGPVTVVIPAAAESMVVVPVYPHIPTFAVTLPTAPTARLDLRPDSGWVNPAPVQVAWSSEHAGEVKVIGVGRGVAWSAHTRQGEETVILGPGPQEFTLVAEPLPAHAVWQSQGGRTAALIDPAGAIDTVDAAAGDRLLYSPGHYTLRVTGRDGLVSEKTSDEVSFPPAFTTTRSGVVDVTLYLTAGSGGTVKGGGVKPFGSKASLAAEPERGHRWVEWLGDFRGTENPSVLTMERDYRVAAAFAPNRYWVTTQVLPVGAGRIEGGGSFLFRSAVSLQAYPEKHYRFIHWQDGPTVSLRSLVVEEDQTLTAEFERLQYRLVVNIDGAGRGSTDVSTGWRPAGVPLAITATPDSVSRFMGWSGEGTAVGRVMTVDMEAERSVTVRFEPKLTQTVDFAQPPDQEPGQNVELRATSSAGLPIRYEWVSGPATVTGRTARVTGLGEIRVRAVADGDDTYLPAAPVERTFYGVASPQVGLNETGAAVRQHDSEHSVPNRIVPGS